MNLGMTALLAAVVIVIAVAVMVAAIGKRRAATIRPVLEPREQTPFEAVELKAASLRREVQEGTLSEAECEAQMRELMIQDAQGAWWMVGYESGAWHRNDGRGWVRADPPR
jgi:hypothetical protein